MCFLVHRPRSGPLSLASERRTDWRPTRQPADHDRCHSSSCANVHGGQPAPDRRNREHLFVHVRRDRAAFRHLRCLVRRVAGPDSTSDRTTGVLSGKPTAAGTFTFAVTASNGTAPDAVTPDLTITVATPAPPVFTADSPPSTATVGSAYSYTFAATGPPAPTYSLASGAVPTGLTLNGTTGELSGSPTQAGTFSFVVKATDGTPPDAVTPTITVWCRRLRSMRSTTSTR